MAGTLKHAKTSGKAAPTDTTKVGGPDWDADHNFAGGALGSLLYRDTGATDGANWLADVAAGSFLRSGGVGAAPVWSTTSWPNSATTGDLLYASGANAYANLSDVATGSVLVSGGVGTAPAWSATPTLTDLTLTGVLKAADGAVGAPSMAFANQPTYGWYYQSSTISAAIAGARRHAFANGQYFNLSDGASMQFGVSSDTILVRDAANTFAQRNSTTAQTFRVYNTFTDSSNYERLSIGWSANVASITSEKAGTGTLRVLNIGPTGFQWQFGVSGLIAVTDNTYDIGASGATRPRTVYIGTSLVLPGGTMLTTSAALTNGAAAATGTLTNAPTAGNPTKWIPINDNGTVRYIPAW